MLTRRQLAQQLGTLAAAATLSELAPVTIARASTQGASSRSDQPPDRVWLDANENPTGPPASAIEAIRSGIGATARYHFDEFEELTQVIAESERVAPGRVLFGVGSAEIINAALCAFTSANRPIITGVPTYEIPFALARSMGRPVIEVPLLSDFGFPVQRLAEEAARAGGGLIYLCNPNNPTASLTPNGDLHWLATNLPPNTVLLVDEAYLDFTDPAAARSAIRYVHANRHVIVTRTFSKIYGMAGMRVGFGCAIEELIAAMNPFRCNVIPILGLRAAKAALTEKSTLIPERRARVARTRSELCRWLRAHKIDFIESHANFVMIHLTRAATAMRADLLRKGIVVGRPFPQLDQMIRVTLGTDEEMRRFREAFLPAYDV